MACHRKISALALVAIAAGGCAPSVRIADPAPLSAEDWTLGRSAAAQANAPLADLLKVPELQALMARALEANNDIRIAQARVEQSRALLKAARAASLPQLSLSGGASKRFDVGSGNALDFKDAFGRLDLTFDPDLFGRLGAAKEAAISRVRAAELQRESIRLAIETQVAAAYVERVAIGERIKILDQNIDRAASLERIIRTRMREGAGTRVDLGLQSIRLLNLRKDRADLVQSLDKTRTSIALLTGAEAPKFDVAAVRPADMAIPDLGEPAPAELLVRRPDIGASEALLEAAKGDVRKARASFLPHIELSVGALIESAAGSPLGKSVTLGSSLLAPIFNRGQLVSDLRFASASQVEAAETYRRTVLSALVDVEDALSAIRSSNDRARLVDSIVEEARLTSHLANVQYIEGEEDLQMVFDAEQLLNSAEDARVLSWQERQLAQIALYAATGGSNGPSRSLARVP